MPMPASPPPSDRKDTPMTGQHSVARATLREIGALRARVETMQLELAKLGRRQGWQNVRITVLYAAFAVLVAVLVLVLKP